MTNCNCDCFCQILGNSQDNCSCCVCDFDFERDNFENITFTVSQQEIERELATSREAIEYFQNKINMLDRQDSDYEWKLNHYQDLLTIYQQNVIELSTALEISTVLENFN